MTEFQIDDEYKIFQEKETGIWHYKKNGVILPKKVEKAFKFYSPSSYNIDSLQNSYFHLSNPSSFNDPFDCNFNLIESSEDLKKINEMTTVKRNNTSNLGVVSMTEVIDNHLMWAHYTNNYCGFVLEFNGKEISVIPNEDQTIGGTFIKVIYLKKLIKVKKEYPFAIQHMLRTKLKHWEYEQEWRFITFLGPKRDRILRYDPGKVKGLYIGYQMKDCEPSAYETVLKIHSLLYPRIPIYIVKPHPTKLELYFESLKQF
ncbi:DUF2971 domain-containing protein [Zobellia laminariae]|uniref:DUF2971 domain-containing protein n=1 Tax=Zobellia laminariae TaxID=248906 RepID=UPI003EF4FB93